MLKRKFDEFLINWKNKAEKNPLIVTGARQVGKTTSIEEFGKTYKSFIEINFVSSPKFKRILESGYEVNDIIANISLLEPSFHFVPGETLIFFDEVQSFPDIATSLKFFSLDGRFDVICSGSMLGVSYQRMASIPVGYKDEYVMRSLDFEEFLWAKGYDEKLSDLLLEHMLRGQALPPILFDRLSSLYKEYLFVGGMPEAVALFVQEGTFEKAFAVQARLKKDYEDDITKYVEGLSGAKVKNFYRHICPQLCKDNHKFQISKLGHGARNRDYLGVEDWLKDAGLVLVANNLSSLDLPLSSYEDPDYFRVYFADHSLFIAFLDDEAKEDLRVNNHYEIYHGALYESLIGEELSKQGYPLYFYKTTDATVELDFVIRIKNEIIPIEVKRNKGRTKSLNAVIADESIGVRHGIKLTQGNIGEADGTIAFPYFLAYLLKRFAEKSDIFSW